MSESYESLESKCMMQEQEIEELRLQLETAKEKASLYQFIEDWRGINLCAGGSEEETIYYAETYFLFEGHKANGSSYRDAVLQLKKKLEPEEKAKELK